MFELYADELQRIATAEIEVRLQTWLVRHLMYPEWCELVTWKGNISIRRLGADGRGDLLWRDREWLDLERPKTSEKRCLALSEAVARYSQARLPIPVAWIEEYNELIAAERRRESHSSRNTCNLGHD